MELDFDIIPEEKKPKKIEKKGEYEEEEEDEEDSDYPQERNYSKSGIRQIYR